MQQPYASTVEMNMPFTGAKIVLLMGDQLITILRDDRPDIPYPNHWDLPGGGREGRETPLHCALRETREELGLTVPPGSIVWGRRFCAPDQVNWFFVAYVPTGFEQQIVFGDEGQRWSTMDVTQFLRHPKAVPQFQNRLKIFLKERSETKNPPLL
ncbi:MAG: NUDIX hydrolase [Paracoccaceae bacterium]|nr:NUDIX hydrolase [Paracoccaceae bacterium]